MASKRKTKTPETPTVVLAEKLLADCRSGKVSAFAVATVFEELAPYTNTASAFLKPDGHLAAKLMVTAIEELSHEFAHALRGK